MTESPNSTLLATLGRQVRSHWAIGIGLLALAGLILAVNPQKVLTALGHADPRLLLLMLPCVLTLYLLHGLTWWIELRRLGFQVPLRQAESITIISQMFVFLPGGDLWRVPLVASDTNSGHRTGTLASAVIFDDLVYFFVLSLAMAFVAHSSILLALGFLLILLPQILIFTILLHPPLFTWIVGKLLFVPPLRRLEPQLRQLPASFRALFTPSVLLPVIVLDLFCSLLAIALFGLGLAAVHAHISWPTVAAIYSFGQVTAGFTVFPAALGAYEGMMTGLVASQGVTPALAAVAALLYRFFNDVFMAFLGLLFALHREAWWRRFSWAGLPLVPSPPLDPPGP